ncbi:peptidylprolyl isomerase [uncultured Muribaculum sp.]|uniref:peptidylprolyl isomerase n=1 Tax=uncultured Muribaculum sp. TaxID=1918613 RepID=UPI0025D8DA42|nr:peptidylprolyl isomerase [uncultured Muribaculum sp.]
MNLRKSLIVLAAATCATCGADAKKPSDPVLMTIDGNNVHLSEFEYLYGKNNMQQQSPVSVDDYLDMFITYKLKVADAIAAGIDTTAAFNKEYEGYRLDLVRPYLTDKDEEERLVTEAYSHYPEEVEASHIMVALGKTPEEREKNKAFLDSLRTAAVGGEDFSMLARKYSIDRSASRNGGSMGYVVPGRFPYAFEKAAYDTPEGQISPVIETPFGFHIVKSGARRAATGEVLSQHILKLTQGKSPEEQAKAKAQIDSIYTLLKNGADFSELARKESEDPGSARNGGMLPWFGTGRMVPEFEKTAFALADSTFSEPFATSYGYHIVKTLGHRGVPSLDEVRPQIMAMMQRDGRAQIPYRKKMDELHARFQPAGADSLSENELIDREVARLAAEDADFANLLREYHDGMLLFEISNRKIWEGAAKDTEGIEKYFEAHRGDYALTEPKYKGFMIYTPNDSMMTVVADFVKANAIDRDSIGVVLKRQFDKDVRVERVLAAKGDNKVVDAVAFGAERPELPGKWKCWMAWEGRLIEAPEEAADVRGAVTTDYQAQLERQWIEQLKATHKVKVNKKVLKKLTKK